MALCTMTRPTVRMLQKHRQTRWASEDQQLQTARESEKTGGRKEKSGKRKGERKRLKGIYKKHSGSEGTDKTKKN